MAEHRICSSRTGIWLSPVSSGGPCCNCGDKKAHHDVPDSPGVKHSGHIIVFMGTLPCSLVQEGQGWLLLLPGEQKQIHLLYCPREWWRRKLARGHLVMASQRLRVGYVCVCSCMYFFPSLRELPLDAVSFLAEGMPPGFPSPCGECVTLDE